jgi:protein-disulfide isomerase
MATLRVPLTANDHTEGGEDAAVILVEYGDYECPHCGVAYHVIKKLQNHYGDGLRFVFRNFPLAQIHPYAEAAAEAAEFAGANGRFWEMHDGIYEQQQRLDPTLLVEIAQDVGLSVEDLRKSLASHEYAARVREDFLGGVRSGVNGTPAFFINGVRHDGANDFESLKAAIDDRLSQRKRSA